MDIHCKRCSKTIPASDINLDTHLAKCASCNSVFDFREQVEGHSKSVRPEVDPPKNIELQPTQDGLEIVRKWFTPKFYALLVFCIFWDGFMVVWYSHF